MVIVVYNNLSFEAPSVNLDTPHPTEVGCNGFELLLVLRGHFFRRCSVMFFQVCANFHKFYEHFNDGVFILKDKGGILNSLT